MIEQADALEWLGRQADDSIDLIVSSPPYEDRRSYGGLPPRAGQAWVNWMLDIWREADRACKGLVCFVVEGKTKDYRYSATPMLLAADLHRAGFRLRKPPIFHRVGIPGSGGPDWWRNDWEWCLCTSKGRLPWSDNTANGHPPKYRVGGELSYRHPDGRRVNAQLSKQPKTVITTTSGYAAGDARTIRKGYVPPNLTNPGNVVEEIYTARQVAEILSEPSDVISAPVGGGKMGSPLAHENEAPFPEALVEPFIRCFCPPGGLVADPFSGSGTVAKVALTLGRRFIGCDLRQSQVDLTLRRLQECSSTS